MRIFRVIVREIGARDEERRHSKGRRMLTRAWKTMIAKGEATVIHEVGPLKPHHKTFLLV